MTGVGAQSCEQPDEPPNGPRRTRLGRALRYAALGGALLLSVSAVAGWVLYERLDGNIRADHDTTRLLADPGITRPPAAPKGVQNVLVMGSDLRPGGDSERSDTVILLHIAADGSRATAMSLPRDLMVDIPGCRLADGGQLRGRFAPFNEAFEQAGASCTIRTVEQLTGIRIDHHVVLHFEGFRKVIDAIDGVHLCLPTAERDDDVGLDLPAGCQLLRGDDALAYVRARKGVADGSDTQRMARQQEFMRTVLRQMTGSGVLGSPTRLYAVLDSVTSSLTTDPALASMSGLYGLADSLRGIPSERITFLTVPRRSYPADPDRDVLSQPAADDLFAALREDRPTG